jgi:hypothetical protein
VSAPKVITQRDVIRRVCVRWYETYGPGLNRHGRTEWRHGEDKTRIFVKLSALDLETCTAEAVNAIIGNSSWTDLTCDCCAKKVRLVVQFGDDPDYDSRTAHACWDCIDEARSKVHALLGGR